MGSEPGGWEVVFLPADPPRASRFALWRGAHHPQPERAMTGATETVELVLPAGTGARRRRVKARILAMAEVLSEPGLLSEGTGAGATAPSEAATASARAWDLALRAGLGLVARGRVHPGITAEGWDTWRVGPLDPADAGFLRSLGEAFPPLAHALAVPGSRPLAVRSPDRLIRACWDAVADSLVRTAAAPLVSAAFGPGGKDVAAPLPGFCRAEPVDVGAIEGWLAECQSGADTGVVLGLRLELAEEPDQASRAVLQVRSQLDPSLVVDAAELWTAPAAVLAGFGPRAEAGLLRSLRRAARAWPPLEPALRQRAPWGVELDDESVADLLGPGAETLRAAGIELLWPADLLESPLRLRAVVRTTPSPGPDSGAGLELGSLLQYQWTLALGDDELSAGELEALAEAKRAFVRIRGRWVSADPALLERVRSNRARRLSAAEVLAGALAGSVDIDGERVELAVQGPLADLAARLRSAAAGGGDGIRPGPGEDVPGPPPGLVGTLRPYQARGLAWLLEMCATGLGGCLADDMGLGKTVQVIALHLARRPAAAGPTLVVCPASLLGNWERELARFAPDVAVRRYHGTERHLDDLVADEVVLVTYGVVRRDRAVLEEVAWGLVVADEAQHVKNPLARTARELRAVPAAARVALTGTPVENRLTDLWAILDWTTPGLLGPLERFRTRVAVPVERYRDPEATEVLSRITRPFLLRRRKTDPGIAPELPPKTETDHLVPLTREQATLYEAVVREAMEEIRSREGIARRGLVLALLTGLKQICNHPAQYLHQRGPLPGRSGKLAALDELVDIVTSEDESVLVFSQYVEMGRLIEAHLGARGVGTRFLHGSVPPGRRQALVDDFQAGTAPVFLLSLKAGGVGLNLTRATHVIHFDRWWNPAVEDQATDRAYRIGQDRPVQVHRLVTEGTVEDRVATLLSAKRALAEAVVGTGEGWLGELSDDDLAELVTLGSQP